MTKLTLRETHRSVVDKTHKLIYTLEREASPNTVSRFTIEVGVIQKGDGKNILCVPTQTNCAQACKFCHLSALAGKVAVSNLTAQEIHDITAFAWADAPWEQSELPLLVSFMGAGEPLANLAELHQAMLKIRDGAGDVDIAVRFGLATMMPAAYLNAFEVFTDTVKADRLPLKVHLSLHYVTTEERKHWMPTTAPVYESLRLLREYRRITGNPIEIHYTLIQCVNDALGHIHTLGSLLQGDPIPVKFLHYNPTPGDTHRASEDTWVEFLRSELGKPKYGVTTEYYTAPGTDIGASCGMFLTDAYETRQAVLVDAPERPQNSIDVTELRAIGEGILQNLKDYPPPALVGIQPLPGRS